MNIDQNAMDKACMLSSSCPATFILKGKWLSCVHRFVCNISAPPTPFLRKVKANSELCPTGHVRRRLKRKDKLHTSRTSRFFFGPISFSYNYHMSGMISQRACSCAYITKPLLLLFFEKRPSTVCLAFYAHRSISDVHTCLALGHHHCKLYSMYFLCHVLSHTTHLIDHSILLPQSYLPHNFSSHLQTPRMDVAPSGSARKNNRCSFSGCTLVECLLCSMWLSSS